MLGAINWDTTIFEGDFARPGEEVPVLKVEEYPGGKGGNSAVASARILGKERVCFIGAVGDDAAGTRLRESLASEGVRTVGLVTIRGEPSGRAFVVVDGAGAKIIHTHFGANEALTPRLLQLPGPESALARSSAVVMDVPSRTALSAARKAKGSGGMVFYSPGVRIGEGTEEVEKILDLADHLIVDRAELARLRPGMRPKEACLELTESHRDLAAVATLGPDGCVVAHGGSRKNVPPFDLSSFGLRAVNSTGSGDAFLAAYAAYSLRGDPPAEAARWGNLAGALKAAEASTRGSPTRKQLESRMARFRARRRGSP